MSNKTILIVDDSLTVRQQVSMTLTMAGYQVIEACDGQDGVDRVRGTPNIAMVLCDLNMPRMNGLEFLENVRKQGAYAALPVVMLTTEGQADLIQRAKGLGAKGWITKPFKPDLLIAVVKKLAA